MTSLKVGSAPLPSSVTTSLCVCSLSPLSVSVSVPCRLSQSLCLSLVASPFASLSLCVCPLLPLSVSVSVPCRLSQSLCLSLVASLSLCVCPLSLLPSPLSVSVSVPCRLSQSLCLSLVASPFAPPDAGRPTCASTHHRISVKVKAESYLYLRHGVCP